MQLRELDEINKAKYFIGNEFLFFDVVENFKYDEEGKKCVKDYNKVTIQRTSKRVFKC